MFHLAKRAVVATTTLLAAAAVVPTVVGGATAASAASAPNFQAPFPCGQAWTGDSNDSSHHVSFEIDFNRGSNPEADLGDTVVAAADGIVRTATNQGSANGYGNLVKIEHAGGWFTFYAHLNRMAVTIGQTVLQGQPIGAVGNTSKPGSGIHPHLHYEVRHGSTYPANIQKAVFNGVTFNYTHATITSHNCANGTDPQAVCGEGFEPNDTHTLGRLGVVVLTWKQATKQNCVVTLKLADTGRRTRVMATLTPQGGKEAKDAGQYFEFAGPVRANAPGCIVWGGAIESTTFTSRLDHC